MMSSEFDPARRGSGQSETRHPRRGSDESEGQGPSKDEPGQGGSGSADKPGVASTTGDAPLREALRPSGPPRFALRVEHQPDLVVVYVEGELDILTVPKLAARINGLIRRSRGDLVLDLRAVEFIDSAGLQLLLNTRRRLLRKSRALSVVCETGPVRRLIELMRLTETLDVKDS
jgi:anti-sigma B factor antagonist